MEHFTRELSSLSLPSLLLQYSEYVAITGEISVEYSKIVSQQAKLFQQFTTLFAYKLDSIAELSTSEEELNIRLVNELSSLNLVLHTIQIKEVLSRLGILEKRLKERGLPNDDQWEQNVIRLNSKINSFFPGGVVAPDFEHGFSLVNSSICRDHHIELGVNLEDYLLQKHQSVPQELFYVPRVIEELEINSFTGEVAEGSVIINPKNNAIAIKTVYEKQVQELEASKVLQKGTGDIDLNFDSPPEDTTLLNKMYRLGCLHAALPEGHRKKLSPWLEQSLVRQKMDW